MQKLIHRRRVFVVLLFLSFLTVFMIVLSHQGKWFASPRLSVKTSRRTYKKNIQLKRYPRFCKAVKQILFLKTHKTGGSTITNILNRFADKNNLTIALPHYRSHRFQWPDTFKEHFINQNRLFDQKPSILCNHARYDGRAMSAAMPNGTVFITILRHPVSLFQSTFSYFKLARFLNISGNSLPDQIRKFFKHSEQFMKKTDPSVLLINNGMMFDLGQNQSCYWDDDCIKRHIKHIEEKFFLILITEYFDESLVLLKRELCWSMEDVTYFMFLKRRTKPASLPKDIQSLILTFNRADLMLYNYFNNSFWKKIEQQDSRFFEEVSQLKELNKQMYKKCSDTNEQTEKEQSKIDVTSIRLKKNLTMNEKINCCQMIRDESQYLKYNNRKQIPFKNLWMRAPLDMGC